MQQGERIQYAGHEWYVNAYDPATDSCQLVRKTERENPIYMPIGQEQTSIRRRQDLDFITVTGEEVARERAEQDMKAKVEAEAHQVMDNFLNDPPVAATSYSMGVDFGVDLTSATQLWQKMMGMQSWSQPPVPSASAAEDDMWAKLAGYGIHRQETGAMADMIKNIAAQFDALAKQAGPRTDNMRKLGDVLREQGFTDDESELGRQGEMNVKYEVPEADGISVLWRKPGGQRRAGVSISIIGIDMGEWDSIGNYECEQVASLADAWTFVDYLNDEELGEAKAIREDACVLFCNEGSWEALTDQPVPEAYR